MTTIEQTQGLDGLSNQALIAWINEHRPTTSSEIKQQILLQFKQRGFNYSHLQHKETKLLELNYNLSLIDECLFERGIPLPPLVGSFYRDIHRIVKFLENCPYLKGFRLVTFDYIFEQLFLTSKTITVISADQLDQLTNTDIFVSFKNNKQQFPNSLILEGKPISDYHIVFDKGNFFRGLEGLKIYRKGELVDQWSCGLKEGENA